MKVQSKFTNFILFYTNFGPDMNIFTLSRISFKRVQS